MPQLEIINYLSQISWFLLLFSIFYYIMKQYILINVYEYYIINKKAL